MLNDAIKHALSLYPDREAWLRARRNGIGASEVAALVLPPEECFASPMTVWHSKVGGEPEPVPADLAERFRWGQIHEESIAREYEERTGRPVRADAPFTIRRHPLSMLNCTLDRTVEPFGITDVRTSPGVLECKTADAWDAASWATSAPLVYQVQVQAQLAVTGYTWGVIAGLIGGNRLVCYEIERDDAFIAMMLDEVAAFWQLVEAGIPPPPDGTESTRKTLRRMFPRQVEGKRIQLPSVAEVWWRIRADAKADLKAAKARLDEAENEIKAAMGDNEIGVVPGCGEFSWRYQKRAASETQGCEMRVLRAKGEKE